MSQRPYCQREDEQVKIGFNRSGSQRFLCKVCRRKYTPVPKPHGYRRDMHEQALAHYVDGLNYRRIGRVLGIYHR